MLRRPPGDVPGAPGEAPGSSLGLSGEAVGFEPVLGFKIIHQNFENFEILDFSEFFQIFYGILEFQNSF